MASPPVPSKKPSNKNFHDILNSTVKPLQIKSDERRIPSPPPPQSLGVLVKRDLNVIITPPPTPDIKKPFQPLEISIVDGIPLPVAKPLTFQIQDNWQNAVPAVPQSSFNSEQEKIIEYSGSGYDERTAGRPQKNNQREKRQRDSGIDRIPSRPREKLKETSEGSPFATAQLPRADQYSMNDPVIIFFKEFSSELEIGQIDVLHSDVLDILRRSSRRRVAVYGYAENARDMDKVNQLSLNRAMIISEFLVDNGIDASRVEARAMGADTPISPKNRVDIIIF